MTTINILYCCVSFLFLLRSSYCYFITIDAHGEECFHDKVTSGTKMGLIFEVAEGGFLDIDVKVNYLYFLVLLPILSLPSSMQLFVDLFCPIVLENLVNNTRC